MSREQLNKPNLEDQLRRLPMNKEVELPPYDDEYMKNLKWEIAGGYDPTTEQLKSRERQLREALAQIATLNARVEDVNEQREDLASLGSEWKHRAEKAEAELATAKELLAAIDPHFSADASLRLMHRANVAEADIAALREEESELFVSGQRVIVNNPRYHGSGIVQYDTGTRKRMVGVLLGNGNTWEYEVETVTLYEHVLDTGENL